jgi:hypothetical protein
VGERRFTHDRFTTKADVKDHQKLPQSLMSPGLLEALPERQVIGLPKFLTSKP